MTLGSGLRGCHGEEKAIAAPIVNAFLLILCSPLQRLLESINLD